MRSPARVALFFVLALVSAAFVLVAGAGRAHAASGSCPSMNPKGEFDGADVTGTNIRGIEAQISTGDGALCGGEANSADISAAWVMLAGPPTNPCAGWAQSGYMHAGGNAPNYNNLGAPRFQAFTEWTEYNPNAPAKDNCTPHGVLQDTWEPIPTDTNTPMYKVSYNSTAQRVEMWIDGKLEDYTNYPGWGAGPWWGQVFGETHSCASDMPGTLSNPVDFGNIKGTTAGDSTWNRINDLVLDTPDCSNYHNQWIANPYNFEIWTH